MRLPIDFFNLSFPFGRLRGIALRMHWFMALMLAVYLLQGATADGLWGLAWMSITLGILLVSILVHELCHCWAAVSLGGSARQILFWPLGGLSFVDYPASPRNNVIVAGAGPLSSLALSGACFVALLVTGAPWSWSLLNPFDSWWPGGFSTPQAFILHAARLNLILALFNLLIPAYPLDGGKILLSLLTARYGRARAAGLTAFIAIPIGVAMAVYGFARANLLLGLLGIWVLFEAWQLRRLVKLGAVDYHPAFAGTLERGEAAPRRPGFFARWRARRADERARRDHERAVLRREQVDAILEKVSREGIGSLNSRERRILQDASRQGHGE